MRPTVVRPRILIVDEDPDVLSLLRILLVLEGYQVAVWADRDGLQAAVETQRPALVLIDPAFRDGDVMAVIGDLRRSDATVWSRDAAFLRAHATELAALGITAGTKRSSRVDVLARVRAGLAPPAAAS
jgi:two-component system OmpR family response regulator